MKLVAIAGTKPLFRLLDGEQEVWAKTSEKVWKFALATIKTDPKTKKVIDPIEVTVKTDDKGGHFVPFIGTPKPQQKKVQEETNYVEQEETKEVNYVQAKSESAFEKECVSSSAVLNVGNVKTNTDALAVAITLLALQGQVDKNTLAEDVALVKKVLNID